MLQYGNVVDIDMHPEFHRFLDFGEVTQLGVYMISWGAKPARSPNCTSWMETASKPAPSAFNNRRIFTLFKAFKA